MRLPRDVSGQDLARRLGRIGYVITRQTGSHMRLTADKPSQHHVTIPNHAALRIGTLRAVLEEVAVHLEITRGAGETPFRLTSSRGRQHSQRRTVVS